MWKQEFDKQFITSHPGDSGPGGSDPQEPIYELNVDWQEPHEEVKRIKAFIENDIIKKLIADIPNGSLDKFGGYYTPKRWEELIQELTAKWLK